ncbi:MAG: hypothetical protein ACYDH6_00785 [Acidimicrobiales bacterium]
MAGPRARRRPAVFVLVAAVITVVILIAQGAASSRPNVTEAVQVYLDRLRPGVQTSTTDGSDFADIRAHAGTLGRDGINRRLARLAASVKSTLAGIDGLTPPPSMRVAEAYLVAALGVRAKAVNEAKPAFDAALTQTPQPGQGISAAVNLLGTVGGDLELGDRAFALFVGALPPGAQPIPPSTWIPDATAWTPISLDAFLTTLRSSASATPVHDLAMVAYQTDPSPVGAQGPLQIIPAVQNMTVTMVVQNVGNQVERNVTITALLTLADGTQQSLRDFIDLAPGQLRAVTLQSMHPPAGQGTLLVTVQPVPGETNLGNNAMSAQVMFR